MQSSIPSFNGLTPLFFTASNSTSELNWSLQNIKREVVREVVYEILSSYEDLSSSLQKAYAFTVQNHFAPIYHYRKFEINPSLASFENVVALTSAHDPDLSNTIDGLDGNIFIQLISNVPALFEDARKFAKQRK